MYWTNKRQYGGVVPGIFKILAQDLNLAIPTGWLYNYLHMRKSSPLSRLQPRCSPLWSTDLSEALPDWACIRRPCVA